MIGFLNCSPPQVVNVSGFESDMFLSNFRIAAGLIACALALAGQFWPGTFPANSRQIGFCVIGYFFFSALMTVPSYFAVADWIDVTHVRIHSLVYLCAMLDCF